MTSTGRIPFIRLLIPFILGIICREYFPFQSVSFHSYLIIPGLTLIGGYFIANRKGMISSLFGIGMNLLFLGFGFITAQSNDAISKTDNFSKRIKPEKQFVCLEVDQLLKVKPGVSKYRVLVHAIREEGVWKNVSGKILLSVKDATSHSTLRPGTQCFVKLKFYKLRTRDGNEFDYAGYMRSKGIEYQSWVQDSGLRTMASTTSIVGYLASARESFIRQMKIGGLSGDELHVASALIFGADEEIGGDLFKAYSATGAVHILSVSGLHVGLVYLVIAWLLDKLFGKGKKQLLKSIILIIFLWLYGGITGLSPSVLRSVTMFSILALGQGIQRSGNPLNSLAVSCFILLLTEPSLVFDVGFQLSYLAVTGIILFYREIHALYEPSRWIFHSLWSVTAVSIAAQIGTLPVSLYYFHQFPLLFILTNIFVIPLAAAILYAGIVLMLAGWITLFNEWICYVLGWMCWLLNHSLEFLAKLPGHLVEGIYINLLTVFLLYLLTVLLASWLRNKKVRLLMACLTVSALLLLSENLFK